jgi:hypothetical protein
VFAAVASVATGFVLPSGAGAVATDQVKLVVTARTIDGTLLFSDATRVLYKCFGPGAVICTVPVERGSTVTIAARAGPQSSWWSWDGPCASFGSTCTFQVNADQTFAATFSARLYLTAFGPGYITREKAVDDGVSLKRRLCSAPSSSDYCADYAYGERIRLRAKLLDGNARMGGWGGTCSNVPATRNCIVTMTGPRSVSASFEYPPPPSDCAPNKSCDPLTPTWPFYIQIYGAGAVMAPKVGSVSARTCDAFTANGFRCTNFEGPQKKRTVIKAFPVHGGKFLGWSGPCSGTAGCEFQATRTPITVYARFG